jgi:type VII secretion integral membrane protein EccD
MTAPAGAGLTRVTVATPHRRIDIALPDHILVADLLPHLLRHAGTDAVDTGETFGGWVLRRTTGVELDADSDLVSQAVRDGELLHLAPRRVSWPEPAYDDIVEVIASSARRTGRSWGAAATRRFGLAATGAVLLLGAALLAWTGSPWLLPGVIGLVIASVLTTSGVLLARAGADAVAGAVVAGYGLIYAGLGGALVTAPAGVPVRDLGPAQLVAAGAVLVLFSTLALIGVAALARVFTAGIGIGAAGLLSGLFCLAGTSGAAAAAIALTVAVGLQPVYPALASSIGRIPLPVLPQRAEAILDDQPSPDRGTIFAAVARASEFLAGELLASAVVSTFAGALLLAQGGRVGAVLALVGAAALLLRGRLFPTTAQRLPLLISGMVTIGLAGYGWALHADTGTRRLIGLVFLLVIAAGVLRATLFYGRRSPSPYVGRIADLLDVLTIMTLIPLACDVLGVFGTVQDLFSSVG